VTEGFQQLYIIFKLFCGNIMCMHVDSINVYTLRDFEGIKVRTGNEGW